MFIGKNKKGVSIIEYAMLIMVILGTLYVMQFYISRAFNGHWKAAGDSLGYGRQYSATKTAECVYSQLDANNGIWYDNNCYQQAVTACRPGDLACEDGAKAGCAASYCAESNQ